MVWYYVEAGQQAGPVDEARFQELVRTNKILPETLVWREGMANWQPCREVLPGMAAMVPPRLASGDTAQPAIAGGETVSCVQCGTTLPRQNAIQYGAVWVCPNCQPSFVQQLQQRGATGLAAHYGYAGFWIRLLAKLIDNLILGALIGIPMNLLMFGSMMGGAFNFDPSRPPSPAWLGLILLGSAISWALTIVYNGLFIGKYQATPGKMALGLKVIMADGSPVTYGRGFLRAISEILSGIVCYIGYIIAAFDDQKRALHDHLVGSRVIKTR